MRANERTQERMAQYSTRRYHSHSTHFAAFYEEIVELLRDHRIIGNLRAQLERMVPASRSITVVDVLPADATEIA